MACSVNYFWAKKVELLLDGIPSHSVQLLCTLNPRIHLLGPLYISFKSIPDSAKDQPGFQIWKLLVMAGHF